jgi:hypothetical protein
MCPVYEYHCEAHGRFEDLVLSWRDRREWMACPVCGESSEYIPSLPAMQPDTLWAGHQTDMGYVSSKSEYNAIMKAKGLQYAEKGDEAQLKSNQERIARDEKWAIEKHVVDTIIGKPYQLQPATKSGDANG